MVTNFTASTAAFLARSLCLLITLTNLPENNAAKMSQVSQQWCMTKADPSAMAGLEQQANDARTQDLIDLIPKAKWALMKKIRKMMDRLVNMPITLT